jgi:hypothetical protein
VLCAWHATAAQTACFGDSGGPLIGIAGNLQLLLGVVSFAYVRDCAREGQLEIYSRVSWHADFIDAAMARDPTLGFATLCPRQPELTVAYGPPAPAGVRVSVSWAGDSKANGWRLYYAPADNPGLAPLTIELPASAREYSVTLQSGQRFHAALQARSTACDSPLSVLQTVVVP